MSKTKSGPSKTKPVASKIMIIRHAEKPPEPPKHKPPPFGVTDGGAQDGASLVVRGWQRAGALATFFAPQPGQPFGSPQIATPGFAYASKIETKGSEPTDKHGKKVGSTSRRPQETITPLLDKLGGAVTPDFSIDKGEEKSLAKSAAARAGVVLICWEHQSIPAIVKHLPVDPRTPAPPDWPTDSHGKGRFDVVWVFDLEQGAGVYGFTQVPQNLLAGDSPD